MDWLIKFILKSNLGRAGLFLVRNFLIKHFSRNTLSLLSQRIVTIVFPGPSSLPNLIAPAILIPQLVPRLKPSFSIKS